MLLMPRFFTADFSNLTDHWSVAVAVGGGTGYTITPLFRLPTAPRGGVWSAFDSHSVPDVQCTALSALIQLAMSTDLPTGLSSAGEVAGRCGI